MADKLPAMGFARRGDLFIRSFSDAPNLPAILRARAGELLEDVFVEPVSRMTGWAADWFGRADAEAPTQHVQWRGYEIPCAPLDAQLATAELRGLTEQVEQIRKTRSSS